MGVSCVAVWATKHGSIFLGPTPVQTLLHPKHSAMNFVGCEILECNFQE
jgi:hypothetical protein